MGRRSGSVRTISTSAQRHRQRASDEWVIRRLEAGGFIFVTLDGLGYSIEGGGGSYGRVSPETFKRLLDDGLIEGCGDGLLRDVSQTYRIKK